jgi:hypothetical protein
MSLQKTKLNTLESIAMEWHDNSMGNWPGAIAGLEDHNEVLHIFFSFWVAGLYGRGKIARLSTLMVGTQQVQQINDMQMVTTR